MSGVSGHKRGRVLASWLIALGIVFAAGCGGQQAKTSGTPGESQSAGQRSGSSGQGGSAAFGQKQEIVFSFVSGFTGDYAPWVEVDFKAAQAAVDEINKAGGPLGATVKVVPEDTQSTVEGAVRGANKAVFTDKVIGIIGPPSDGVLALLDFAAKNKVPVISHFAGTADLDTKGGNYVFRTAPSDTLNGIAQARLALQRNLRKIAGIYENEEGPTSSWLTFKKAFEEAGGQIVADIGINPGQATYQAELDKAFQNKPDAFFLSAGFESSATLLREWKRRGYGGTWLFSPELVNEDIIKAVGADVLQGILGLAPTEDTNSEGWKHFVEVYKARWNEDPTPGMYQSNAYDAVILYALAVEAAGEATGEGIAKNLYKVANPPGDKVTTYADAIKLLREGKDIDYQGASGPLNFDQHGNVKSPFAEFMVNNGKWEQTKILYLE